MSKPSVLLVGAFPPDTKKIYGGIVTSCRTLINSSFGRKFELILIDSTQISNPAPSIVIRALFAVSRFTIFLWNLKFKKPQAVLLFSSGGASAIEKGLMARACRIFRVPALFFPRGSELIGQVKSSIPYRIVIQYLIRGATYCVCQGPAWHSFATEVLGFQADHVPIVTNWTATDSLLAIGAQRKPTLTAHIPQLLFLGWLESHKGIFELLEVCERLSPMHTFRMVIAGDGCAASEARAFMKMKNLSGVVDFVGWVEGEALESLLAASDIFILPSWSEGFPNSMIEAMAAKLAVVVTAVGNIPGLVTDGQEALVVPPMQIDLLRYAVESLLLDRVLREEIAERGYAFARENFSVESSINNLVMVVEKAIEENLSVGSI